MKDHAGGETEPLARLNRFMEATEAKCHDLVRRVMAGETTIVQARAEMMSWYTEAYAIARILGVKPPSIPRYLADMAN